MPVRSVIYKEQRLVVTIEEGRVTFDDMLANQNRLVNDPDFDPEFNQLSDATLATDTDLSEHNLKMLYNAECSPLPRDEPWSRLPSSHSEWHGCSKLTSSYRQHRW